MQGSCFTEIQTPVKYTGQPEDSPGEKERGEFPYPWGDRTPHIESLGKEGFVEWDFAWERCKTTPWSSISCFPGSSPQLLSCFLSLTDCVEELEASREDANRTMSLM